MIKHSALSGKSHEDKVRSNIVILVNVHKGAHISGKLVNYKI